jgi:chromosome segregation ATPase
MANHSHLDYEAAISSLRSDVGSLESGMAGLRSGLGDVQRDVSRLDKKADAIEEEVNGLQADVDAIGQHMAEYAQLIGNMANALTSGREDLASMAERFSGECDREETHRGRVRKDLTTLQDLQSRLSQTLEASYTQMNTHLAGLQQEEAEFQKQLVDATHRFQQILDDLSRHLRGQLGGLEEEVSTLKADEQQSLADVQQEFLSILHRHEDLRGHFSAIDASCGRLAESMAGLVKCQDQMEAWLAEQKLSSSNATGLRLLASGQFRAAVSVLRGAVEQNPDRRETRLNLAVALLRGGSHDEAAVEAAALLSAFPDHPEVRLLNAALALRAGRAEEAAGFFEACLKDWPADPQALCGLGIAHLQAGRPEPARDAFQQALQDPTAADDIREVVPPALLEQPSGLV